MYLYCPVGPADSGEKIYAQTQGTGSPSPLPDSPQEPRGHAGTTKRPMGLLLFLCAAAAAGATESDLARRVEELERQLAAQAEAFERRLSALEASTKRTDEPQERKGRKLSSESNDAGGSGMASTISVEEGSGRLVVA